MYIQELISAGLSEREARVYLAALELGETTVDRIAKKSGVKRTTVYLEAEALKAKGLLSAVHKGKKAYLFAEDPRVLERSLEERKEALQKSLPGILALANFIDKKPKVRYFEGKEGIKEVLNDTLRYPGQEICTWYSGTYKLLDIEDFFDSYVANRVAKRISVRAIYPDNEVTRHLASKNEKSLRRTRFVQFPDFQMPIELTIYAGFKVNIISYPEEIGMTIESEKVNQSLRSIFEVMWAGLPEH